MFTVNISTLEVLRFILEAKTIIDSIQFLLIPIINLKKLPWEERNLFYADHFIQQYAVNYDCDHKIFKMQ